MPLGREERDSEPTTPRAPESQHCHRKPARTQYPRTGAFLGLFSPTARGPGREFPHHLGLACAYTCERDLRARVGI